MTIHIRIDGELFGFEPRLAHGQLREPWAQLDKEIACDIFRGEIERDSGYPRADKSRDGGRGVGIPANAAT